MGAMFENIYDLLFTPRAAFTKINANHNLWQALVVFLLSVLIPLGAVYLGVKSSAFATGLLPIAALAAIATWPIGTAIWHLCAELLGGRGSALGLLAAIAYANFPKVFIVPLWVLTTLFSDALVPTVMTVTGLVIGLWTLTLEVLAIGVVYQVPRSKAMIIFLAPVLLGAVCALLVVFFAGAALVEWPLKLTGVE